MGSKGKEEQERGMKMKRFTLCFRERDLTNWHMILNTTEDYTPRAIMKMIETERERIIDEEEIIDAYGYSTLSPVRIMDNLVAFHPGWDWEEFEFDVEIEE